MRLQIAMIGLALFAVSSQAIADTPASPPAKTSKNDPDRIICRTEDELGSRIHKRKICMTVAQWKEVSQQAGMATERKEALVSKPGGG